MDNQKEFLSWLARAEDNITEEGEDVIVADPGRYYNDYLSRFNIFNGFINEGSLTQARDYYYNEIFSLFENVKQQSRNLVDINQKKMVVLQEKSEVIARNATLIALVVSSITIIT